VRYPDRIWVTAVPDFLSDFFSEDAESAVPR
jgi:hypothetical protein